MKILICTGIYPPRIGGPAQYTVELEKEMKRQGHTVSVLTYGVEYSLPIGIRHIYFFFRAFVAAWKVDAILALDTLSVGLPAIVAARLVGKKSIIRTGGDFLWESYVERTGDKILLKNFYSVFKQKINLKERAIFYGTRFALKHVHALVFSTAWQRDIFMPVYGLDPQKNYIIENEYKPAIGNFPPTSKTYLWAGRLLTLKNIDALKRAFKHAQRKDSSVQLSIITDLPKSVLIEKIKECYVFILPSISDISPNVVLDALRYGKPCIVTSETGISDRLGDHVVYIDPCNEADIEEKILQLSLNDEYKKILKKTYSFSFTHSIEDMVRQFITLCSRIQ